MSNLTGVRSKFKESTNFELDNIKEVYDISPSKIQDANRLRELKSKPNPSQSEQEQINQLSITLNDYIITAERWNLFGDVIINMQKFFKSNVVDIVNAKKQEIENEVNRFTQSLENKEQEFVNNIRQFTTEKTQEVTTHVRDKKQEIEQFVTQKTDSLSNTISQKEQQFNQEMAKFTDKGEYNPSTQYHVKNMIRFEGNVYLCIKDALGKHPSNIEYWTKLTIKGDTGYAVGLNPKGAFNIGTQYKEHDLVQYEGSLYRAKQNVRGVYPTNTQNWEVFLSGNGEKLSELQTEHKLSLVGAINENNSIIKTHENNITDNRQKLEDKANKSHTHSTADIIGLDNTINQALDANSILAKLKTVDGTGSGLDADLVKGVDLSPITQDFDTFKYTFNTDKISEAEQMYMLNSDKLPTDSDSLFVNMAMAISNHADELSKTVKKVQGKGLSSNDFIGEYKNKLDSIKMSEDSNITIGKKSGDTSVGIYRNQIISDVIEVDGGTALDPNMIKVLLPIRPKTSSTRNYHISGKLRFFNEDKPTQTGLPFLSQPVDIDFSFNVESVGRGKVFTGQFTCEHLTIRPELYAMPEVFDIYLYIKLDETAMRNMTTQRLFATFTLNEYSRNKLDAKLMFELNDERNFSATLVKITNTTGYKQLKDNSLFQLSVDGKKKIADAINGKTGSSSANANMSFEELKGEINNLIVDDGKPMTTDGSSFNFSDMSSMKNFIANNKSKMLKYPNIFNTQNVTDMSGVFYNCYNLTTVPLFNTSNVTNMNSMFRNCYNLTTLPLFDSPNVTDMMYICFSCKNLTTVPLFNTQNVRNMTAMFRNCTKITTVPLLNTQNVRDMEEMFRDCSNLTTVPLFNTSNVTNMNSMFRNCYNLEFVPNLNTSNVTTFSNIFTGCTSLNIPRMRQAGWEEKFLQTAPNYTAP